MKIIATSDIHMKKVLLNRLSHIDGDLLLICGDFSNTGSPQSLDIVLSEISKLDFKYIVATMGNHDIDMERDLDKYRTKYPKIKFLDNETCEVEGIKIYGSPYCLEFNNWAFPYINEIDCRNKTIPKSDIDIIICHEPPYHKDLSFIGDMFYGNEPLREFLETNSNSPEVLFCGHIHENSGNSQLINQTLCVNCSQTIIEYEFEK